MPCCWNIIDISLPLSFPCAYVLNKKNDAADPSATNLRTVLPAAHYHNTSLRCLLELLDVINLSKES